MKPFWFFGICLVALASSVLDGRSEMGPGWYAGEAVAPPEPVSFGEQVNPPENFTPPLGSQEFQSFGGNLTASEVTAEVQQLAEQLNNDPLEIFNFFRNNIAFQPYFGSCKGAHGTLLDGAGNDMDQASLLISLLNAAGYTNTLYVYGKVSVPDTATDGNDLAHWLGTTKELTSWILAYAQIPNLSGVTSMDETYVTWTFDHVWVMAEIDGTTYDLDPSYKTSTTYAGVDFKTISGYSRSQLQTDAGGTTGANSVQNVSRASIENRLAIYADNLADHIATNLPNSPIEEIIGGSRLVEVNVANLIDGAPRTSFSPTQSVSIAPFATIPSQYRASIRVRIDAEIDSTLFLDCMAGQRLSLVFAEANAQLWFGDSLLDEETNGSGATASVTLSIAHPYAGHNQNVGEVNYSRDGWYDLTHAIYPVSDGRIRASDARLEAYVAAGLADDSREVITEALHGIGLRWVRSSALSSEFVSRVQNLGQPETKRGFVRHVLGRTGQQSGYFVDMPAVLSASFGTNGSEPNSFKAGAFVKSAMEHGVIEQSGASLALSTIKCLAIANDEGQKIFRANSANWNSISGQLINYGSLSSINGFINIPNSVLLLHEDGETGANEWSGYGIAVLVGNSSVGMVIFGGYAGGYNSEEYFLSGRELDFLNKTTSEEEESPTGVPQALSAEPVDLATGAYVMTATDLALGESDSPRGLNLSRSYDSSRNFQSTALGNGWRHSCDGKIFLTSDTDAAFGIGQPIRAAQSIIAALAIPDFIDPSLSAQELLVGALASNWFVNQTTNNAANVQLGEQRLTYFSQPDGTWTPPPATTTKLLGTSGSFVLQPRFGGSIEFDAQNRVSQWKDVDQNTQTYTYDSENRLASVGDSQGRTLTFTYLTPTSPLIESVSDGTGRTVSYSYTNNNLTSIEDPEGFNTSLVYDSSNRLIDWLDHTGLYVVRNTYDSEDRVSQQLSQGDSQRLWQFLYSPGETQEVDPLNNITAHIFDSKNRRIGITDPLGNSSTVAYNDQNRVTQAVDATGRTTTFTWNEDQNLTHITDNAGEVTLQEFDSSLRLWKITDPTGRVTEFGYDSENHLTSTKDPGGRTTTISYRPDGRVQQITDPDNKTTTLTAFDQWANPIAITRPDATTTSATFNARGDLTSFTDGRGKSTAYSYDKRRLLISRTDPLLHVTTWSYDSNRNPTTTTNRNNKTATTVFDNFDKIQSLAAPDTGTTTFGYDLRDLNTSATDGLGHTTTFSYDNASRATSTTDSLSIAVLQTSFDQAGRVTSTANGLNQTTQLFYDSVGRLSYSLDPLNRRIDKTYDEAGREISLKNRNGNTFSFGYGTDGLPTTFTYPSGRESATLNRDSVGRPTTIEEPSGQQTSITYDPRGRVKTKSDGVGSITWNFDAEGNPLTATEGNATITRTFDDLGRILTCTDTLGQTISYTYDPEGNLTTLTYPDGKTVTYTYDGSNRLKTVTDWASRVTTYTYDAAGRLTQTARPNGTTATFGYDDANRHISTDDTKSGAPIWQATYGYDNAYRLTSFHPTPPTRTFAPPPATMSYDSDNRLVTYNGPPVSNDPDGNLLQAPLNGTLLGNLTWDTRNRLVETQSEFNIQQSTISYAYDSENRRTSQTVNGQTTTYTWSRGASLDRLLVKTNPDGSITRYIHGLGLLYEETEPVSGPTTTQYYHYNWQGSTMALTDGSGTVTARFSYSPYGEVTPLHPSGFGNPVPSFVPPPFLFNGQFGVMTEPNGLYCMQARFYSPTFRRFLSEDPSGFAGGINLYAYTGGDPVNMMDPFGLGPVKIGDQLFGFAADLGNSTLNLLGAMAGTTSAGYAQMEWQSGNYGMSIGWWTTSLLEAGTTIFTLGQGSGWLQGGKTAIAQISTLRNTSSPWIIRSYRELQAVTAGERGVIQAHHIIEERHLINWGYSAAEAAQAPAVILSRAEHQAITAVLQSELPYGQAYSREAVKAAYQKAYAEAPEWLSEMSRFFNKL